MGPSVCAVRIIQITDLETGDTQIMPYSFDATTSIAVDPGGTILVSASYVEDWSVRVGPISGEEPQLLLGHKEAILALAVSPDGRRVASAAQDGTMRLWPVPDLSKPPLHTLPHDELIAKLKSLTNLRVVRDAESSTGWKVEVGPFPGWKTVPTW